MYTWQYHQQRKPLKSFIAKSYNTMYTYMYNIQYSVRIHCLYMCNKLYRKLFWSIYSIYMCTYMYMYMYVQYAFSTRNYMYVDIIMMSLSYLRTCTCMYMYLQLAVWLRDILEDLCRQKVYDVSDFEWQRFPRPYSSTEQQDGELRVQLHCLQTRLDYGFEYLGCRQLPVFTPRMNNYMIALTQVSQG